jgi:rod shape-determining protein MreC
LPQGIEANPGSAFYWYREVTIKPLFVFSPALTAKLVFFMAVSVLLMTVDHRSEYLQPVRSTLNLIAYPIQYLITLPRGAYTWASEYLATREHLCQENRALREQYMLLSAKLQKFQSLERENNRLRSLLASASRFKNERLLIAELLSVDLDPYKQLVVINKGETDGVYVGQPLLDANGVMGQITYVNPLSATAILISDPSHALPVQINRNGLRTLVIGTGNANELILKHIPSSGDIKPGDVVSTSGLGGRFPPDYPVGKITHIERPPGEPFARVNATPFAHLDRSREVLLVWP